MDSLRPAAPYRDPARRRSLMSLLDGAWPGMSERIDRARAQGFDWDAVTEPFVAWEGDEAVCHVGVIEVPLRVAGQDHVVAGIHAVTTRADRRGRGLARQCLAAALAWADERHAIAQLGTDLPGVYAPHGFRLVKANRFHVDRAGGRGGARRLDPAERDWFLETCAAREPVSDRYAVREPGWLAGIDLALQRRTLADLHVVGEAIVDWEVRDGDLVLHEVIARRLPTLDELAEAAPAHQRVTLTFCPDKLAPDARPEPIEEPGGWMVRGPWPLPDDEPFALGRLQEH